MLNSTVQETSRMIRALLLVVLVMFPAVAMLGDVGTETTETAAPAELSSEKTVVIDPPPDFSTYLFVAYGLTCALLCVFTLWTATQTRNLEKSARYLHERFDRGYSEDRTAPETSPQGL